MTFFSTNLTCRNVNARTKNARIRSRWNLIRAWTRLIMITSSAITLKIKPLIAKVSSSRTMKATVMTIKSSIETRRKLRWWSRLGARRMRIRVTFIKSKSLARRYLMLSHHCRNKQGSRISLLKNGFFS